MPMSMQGGAPVQMPQGMYMPPGQPMYGPPVMMPGAPLYPSRQIETQKTATFEPCACLCLHHLIGILPSALTSQKSTVTLGAISRLFVLFTVKTDVVLLRAGSPGQYMMYPGGPRPQFVNVMPAFGHVVAYPGGPPGSPGGPPPAGAPSTCHKLIVQFWHGMRCW